MADQIDYSQLVMNVEGFRIGASPDDPGHVALSLSARKDGPHFNFRFDAQMLDKLSAALADAAMRLRATAN